MMNDEWWFALPKEFNLDIFQPKYSMKVGKFAISNKSDINNALLFTYWSYFIDIICPCLPGTCFFTFETFCPWILDTAFRFALLCIIQVSILAYPAFTLKGNKLMKSLELKVCCEFSIVISKVESALMKISYYRIHNKFISQQMRDKVPIVFHQPILHNQNVFSVILWHILRLTWVSHFRYTSFAMTIL